MNNISILEIEQIIRKINNMHDIKHFVYDYCIEGINLNVKCSLQN